MKFDLSQFKKIQEDKDTAVMQHPEGHHIVIAKSILSPKGMAELKKLPLHKADAGIVEDPGNRLEIEEIPQDSPEALRPIEVEQIPAQSRPLEIEQISPEEMAAETLAPADPQVDKILTSSASATPPNQMRIASESPGLSDQGGKKAAPVIAPANPAPKPLTPEPVTAMPGQVAPQTDAQASPDQLFASRKNETSKEMMEQAQAWQNDLQNGHIKPQTYADLFGKKDTLGKIGMIFGMIASGMGAGLTKQPNALLAKMDAEIARDLEAQKQSKTNAHNFLTLNQTTIMNQAQKKYLEQQGTYLGQQGENLKIQGQKTRAEMGMIPEQMRNLRIDSDMKAHTLGQIQMLQSSFHTLVKQTEQMPEGPEKEAAKQALAMIYQRNADKIVNLVDQSAGASAYAKMLYGGQSQGGDPESAFQKQISGLKMMGPQGEARAKDMEEKHLPGVPGSASIPISPAAREEWNSLKNLNHAYKEATDFLEQSSKLGPAWSAENRAKAASISTSMMLEIGQLEKLNRFTHEEAKLYKDLLPDFKGTHFTNQDLTKMKMLTDKVQAHAKNVLSGLGIPMANAVNSAGHGDNPATPQAPAPKTATKNGVKYVQVAGGWQKVPTSRVQ